MRLLLLQRHADVLCTRTRCISFKSHCDSLLWGCRGHGRGASGAAERGGGAGRGDGGGAERPRAAVQRRAAPGAGGPAAVQGVRRAGHGRELGESQLPKAACSSHRLCRPAGANATGQLPWVSYDQLSSIISGVEDRWASGTPVASDGSAREVLWGGRSSEPTTSAACVRERCVS